MKKGLMIALVILCAGLAAGCSGQSSDRSAENTESPVADTSGRQNDFQEQDASGEQDTSKEQNASGEPDASKEQNASGEQDTSKEQNASGEQDKSKKQNVSEEPGTSKKQDTSDKTGTSREPDISEAIAGGGTASEKTGKTSITIERAKKIALKKAGLQEQDGRWKKEKTDWEDGRKVYELEFISDRIEYEFEIDAENGNILEYDKDFD